VKKPKIEELKLCKESQDKMVKEFNKSFSNTSTTSVESGVFDLDDSFETPSGLKLTIGDAVKEILMEADKENRLICGFNDASKYLKETEYPEHSLFFFIAPSNGDSVSHMHEVLLQAFCFENDIYIVKLDSADKLNSILDSKDRGVTCALVQRSAVMDMKTEHDEIDLEKFTELENILIDHCEDFWSEPIQPIIRLPDK
jgi:growth arrest and DNA-damage-inducible protein